MLLSGCILSLKRSYSFKLNAGIGSSSIVKSMGSRHFTFTFSPLFSPGIHLDIRLSTRMASLSSWGFSPCTTSILEIEPSAATMNEHRILPSIPC